MNNFPEEIGSSHIKILETLRDFGPITKFTGLLQFHKYELFSSIDYWIICDDDVEYVKSLISRYVFALYYLVKSPVYTYDGGDTDDSISEPNAATVKGIKETISRGTILTHFSEDFRIYIRLDGEEKARAIQHLQGVDTFLVPADTLALQTQNSNQLLTYDRFTSIVQFFHAACPLSFFQDDYIISFVFNVANETILSIWNNQKVAGHIEGIRPTVCTNSTRRDKIEKA